MLQTQSIQLLRLTDIWARMHDAVLVYAETSGYVGTSKSETS